MIDHLLVVALGLIYCCTTSTMHAGVPADYRGKPFADAYHKAGTPNIPGIVQCALYDLGGEGIAYHDTDATNNGSGKMNLEPSHQRAHAGDPRWRRPAHMDAGRIRVRGFVNLFLPSPSVDF